MSRIIKNKYTLARNELANFILTSALSHLTIETVITSFCDSYNCNELDYGIYSSSTKSVLRTVASSTLQRLCKTGKLKKLARNSYAFEASTINMVIEKPAKKAPKKPAKKAPKKEIEEIHIEDEEIKKLISQGLAYDLNDDDTLLFFKAFQPCYTHFLASEQACKSCPLASHCKGDTTDRITLEKKKPKKKKKPKRDTLFDILDGAGITNSAFSAIGDSVGTICIISNEIIQGEGVMLFSPSNIEGIMCKKLLDEWITSRGLPYDVS
jgi:hypothetical protein